MEMDLVDPGKWRKSKVESFIRRHLNIFDLGITRYYEMCMWDNRGTLVPTYALLMDNAILLTENPPKSILHTIPLSAIRDISLIADRHSLIKGKNNNSFVCQHVLIVYEEGSKNGKLKDKPSEPTFTRESSVDSGATIDRSTSAVPLPTSHSRVSSSPSPPTNFSDVDDKDSNCTNHSHTDLSTLGMANYSSDIGSSVSPVPSSVALEKNEFFSQSFLHAYEPAIRKSTNGNGINGNMNNNYNAWLESKARRHHHHHNPNKDKMNNVLINKNDLSARSTPLSSTTSFSPEKTRTTWDTHRHGDNLFSRLGRRGRPTTAIPSGQLYDDTTGSDGHSSNSNTNTTATTNGSKNKENVTEKKMRSKKKIKGGANKVQQKVENIQLYFYQRDSEFVNELSLVWNRQQLKNTEKQDLEFGGRLSKNVLAHNKSLRVAEKIVDRVAQDWIAVNDVDMDVTISVHRKINRKMISYENLLRKVAYLHKCLMRYEHLKYLCWKNAVIMSGLINAMMACLEPIEAHHHHNHRNGDMSSLDIETIYWDKVAIYAILMDIFRTLFEACSVSWFKDSEFMSNGNGTSRHPSGDDDNDNKMENEWESEVWDHKLTIFDVTRKLLWSILRCPFLPQSREIPGDHDSSCLGTITDPQKFIKAGGWLTMSDESAARMVKLICTAHNASVALLFELLAIAHFLPTVIEKTLVTCSVRQLNLERYVRLSVTQIINILWNNREPINSAQTMILYRQLWNLRNLVHHDSKVLEFIRDNFSEEFQYYVHTRGIKSRIPDQYTIKVKVIDACEQLCEDIVGKKGRSNI